MCIQCLHNLWILPFSGCSLASSWGLRDPRFVAYMFTFSFTFIHLADTFIQRQLQVMYIASWSPSVEEGSERKCFSFMRNKRKPHMYICKTIFYYFYFLQSAKEVCLRQSFEHWHRGCLACSLAACSSSVGPLS